MIVTERSNFVIENTVRNGKNADNEHFVSIPTIFSKDFFVGVIKCLNMRKSELCDN